MTVYNVPEKAGRNGVLRTSGGLPWLKQARKGSGTDMGTTEVERLKLRNFLLGR